MIFRLKNRLTTRILTALLLICTTVFLAGGSLRMAFASETEEAVTEETVDSSMEDPAYSEPESEAEVPEEQEPEADAESVEESQDPASSEEPQETEETQESSAAQSGNGEDAGESDVVIDETKAAGENPEWTEDDFIVTDEVYVEEEFLQDELTEEPGEEEEEIEEEVILQFAGESGATDFETLPLLELSPEELKICTFCSGKNLGKVQTAVLLSYVKAGNDALDCAANDGLGILASFGLAKKDYSAWCKKSDLKKEDLNSQLSYLYSMLFRDAGPDTTVSMFKKSESIKPAATALYSMARVRNIRMIYTKEDITEVIIPAAQHYLELFTLGGEKRKGTAGVAYYCQGNYTNVPYDTDSVAGSGCGITAFSMVASELTGLNLGPEVTATWAYENGVNTVTNWGSYWWLAQRFGVEFLGQYSGGFDLAVEALKEGNLVIASLRKDGFFTTSDAGHYILLTGVEEDGRICVNDPASYERSVYGPFEYSAVFGSCLQFWIFGR